MKSLLDRLFGRRKAEAAASRTPIPPITLDTEIDATLLELGDSIRRDVASGFYDEDAILTHAAASFEKDLDAAVLRREAQRVLREALAVHKEAQRRWPARTDCDRLDDAFQALERTGVVARQHFTCCGSCGSTEIWDEIDAVRKLGVPTRGYAFYHAQDTDAAAEGDGLYLNYGACEEGEDAALAIGRDIVTQLQAHGLRTEWDGRWEQRIGVSLDWKRRR